MPYLSLNQIKQYQDQGFLAPLDVFSNVEAKKIRDEMENYINAL